MTTSTCVKKKRLAYEVTMTSQLKTWHLFIGNYLGIRRFSLDILIIAIHRFMQNMQGK